MTSLDRGWTVPQTESPPAACLLPFAVWVMLFCAGCGADKPSPQSTGDEVDTAPAEPAWFRDVSAERGVDFVHVAHGAEQLFFPAIMSSGGAFLDYDNDGRLDLLLTGTSSAPLPGRQPGREAGTGGGTRLFRQAEDGQFRDVTKESGVVGEHYANGVAVGDVNNDGHVDFHLTCYGPDRLWVNQGDGTFRDMTEEAGISNTLWGASASFVDYDRDGWLDLFVTNYVDYDAGQPCVVGTPDFCNPAMFPRTADKLFRNLGGAVGTPASARFEDVTVSSGVFRHAGAGLGVVGADLTRDGWPDFYVANDGHANFLWVNQQDGTFREEAVLFGVAYDPLGRGQASMGLACEDFNGDLAPDLVATHLDGENNALYLSEPHGYRDRSMQRGLGGSFPYTGFGVALFDGNHDGQLDLLVANGRVRRRPSGDSGADGAVNSAGTSQDEPEFQRLYADRNSLYQGTDEGRLRLRTEHSDPFLSPREVSRGLALGDVDNDGDLDVLLTNCNGPARLLLNEAPKQGDWLSLRAVDPKLGGRDAYGAQVLVRRGGRTWSRLVLPCSSYQSCHDPRLHFGLPRQEGEPATIDEIEVTWPDGERERFPGGATNTTRSLVRGEGAAP